MTRFATFKWFCVTTSIAIFLLLGGGLSKAESLAGIPLVEVPDSKATDEKEMKPYTDIIVGADVKFDMVPIPGGKFMMGSAEGEEGRKENEGPQHEITIEPFWMGKHEVRWEEFEEYTIKMNWHRRHVLAKPGTSNDKLADAMAHPTKPFTDMTFGMGKEGFPAISMTHYAARMYCKWLSTKTGRYYRLPTEAEWEYACRAGTSTAYSFGDDPSKLGDYAWYFENANGKYQKVGKKKPNPWGLYDMHGNACEWVMDQYVPDFYAQFKGKITANPVAPTTKLYSHVARGGHYDDDPEMLRSATRVGSEKDWKQTDPQSPQSVWYFTDAKWVGFRLVRPLQEPTAEEKAKIWDVGLDVESEGARIEYPGK